MKPSLLVLVVLAACGGAAPTTVDAPEAPEAPTDPVPGSPPAVPEDAPAEGVTRISARELPVSQELEVAFARPGKDGCYRQSDVTTTFGDHVVTHAYTTSSADGACSQALVPGGFTTRVRFPSAGAWQGKIVVDGQEVGLYFVDVTGT